MNSMCKAIVLVFIFTSSVLASGPGKVIREDILVNTSWKFHKGDAEKALLKEFNDKNWTTLNLPHTWNNYDGQDGGGDFYRGTGWYRKQIFINSNHSEKNIYIQFDGSNRKTDVYVNGGFAGTHIGGFSRFRFNLTPFIKFGEKNLIAIRVNNEINNSIPVEGDFTFCGGLYRSVHLLITEKLHVDVMDYGSCGVYVNAGTDSDGAANIAIKVRASNDDEIQKKITLRTQIKDKRGITIKYLKSTEIISPGSTISINQNTQITSPVLWNGVKDPALYAAKVEILEGEKVKDVVEQKFGIRNIKIDSEKGLFLNGRYLKLKGVNRHQDKKDKGWAISTRDQIEDMKVIGEMGANAIRCAHYQQDQLWYNLCDKNGMIVWTEVPFFGRALENDEFYLNAKQQLWEMIKQNYNHPSIAFWGIGNETLEDSTVKLLKELNFEAHQADSTRPTTYASNKKDEDPLNEITDVLAFNKYYGWYRENTEDFSNWLVQFHHKYPQRKTGISEYGAGASVFQHENDPVQRSADQPWHPEENQTVFHEKTWNNLKDKE
ncbi:MAG: glycoside hydrolase family 2 protein, partial [Syntrophothermus sp.]